ncbi:MAG: pyridoxamine kinase, partial [Bacteroidales bacterium]
IVVITSLPVSGIPGQTSVVAYDRSDEKFWKVVCQYLPAEYPGTGDAFTSALLGALMQGDILPLALIRAVQFVSQAILATLDYGNDPREGIMLERVLDKLDNPGQLSSCELIE